MSDNIDKLCALVKEAGGTMRLYGKPVTAEQLREHAAKAFSERIRAALKLGIERAKAAGLVPGPDGSFDEEAQWRAVWADEVRR